METVFWLTGYRSTRSICNNVLWYHIMPLFTPRTWARVPFGASFASHAHGHAYESAHAFMFIATRFCLLFLPKCCKCDIIIVDDRLLRKRSKESAYLANKPQKPYQKIPRFSSLCTQDTRRKLRDASIIDIMPLMMETTFYDEFRMSIWVNQHVLQRHMVTADRATHFPRLNETRFTVTWWNSKTLVS